MKVAMKVAYHGPGFFGFQRQSTLRTVQGDLEKALTRFFREPVELAAAGRTDAGVHGLGQVVGFSTETERPLEGMVRALNGRLQGAYVREAARLKDDDPFHPRFDALSRTYHYRILGRCRQGEHIHWSGNYWCLADRLDQETLLESCRTFLGEHDFSTFSSRSVHPNPVRRLLNLSVTPAASPLQNTDAWLFEVRGNAFLRKMVRLQVAAIVEAGLGRRTPADLQEMLQARNPARAPHPAPAEGLYFHSVTYQNDPFQSERAVEIYRPTAPLGYRFKR